MGLKWQPTELRVNQGHGRERTRVTRTGEELQSMKSRWGLVKKGAAAD